MLTDKPLFIFEMANNHMGDANHGRVMIDAFGQFVGQYPFKFAFKFQFRDIPTFIHPDVRERMDIPYVRRFTETALDRDGFAGLIRQVRARRMLVIATAFDEPSVDLAVDLNVDVIKIASCSMTDWPLLEKIVLTDKPLIVSTAGAGLDAIDSVVSFFQHREKEFAVMHCVGEYPTALENLQLNQISLLKERYPGVPVGFSTHEDPKNCDAVLVAFGKGARLFEKHVAVQTEQYPKNAYSATPEDVRVWLDHAHRAYRMMGVADGRHPITEKEKADLRRFQRGVFVKTDLPAGRELKLEEVFYAFPNQEDQLLANDLSKYRTFTLKTDLRANAPVLRTDLHIQDDRARVHEIVQDIKALFQKAGVVYPGGAELEISHHYGIEKFHKTGITMITVVNRGYCKKLIAVLPGQHHPEQSHREKEETFHVLYGDVQLFLDGVHREMRPGETVTIEPGARHSFTSNDGCIIEEISTTHCRDDSFYSDDAIMRNEHRKTLLKYWLD